MGFVVRNVKRIWGRLTMPEGVPKEIPLPNLLHKVLDRIDPCWRDRRLESSVASCRANYACTLQRLRAKWARGEKIRVLFLAQCSAKWKAQSVYDALKADGRFEPLIAVSHPIDSQRLSPRETHMRQDDVRKWFEAQGDNCIIEYDALKDRHLNLQAFGADIVFYPEASYPAQSPVKVSRFALTGYIPYYVPNYGDKYLDTGLPNHRLFFRYFALNDDWISLYEGWMAGCSRAGDFVASGHPMLDQIRFDPDQDKNRRQCVIYAPHWSFTHPNNPTMLHFGTFTWSGLKILEYAQSHREVEWIFKPHPHLCHRLVSSGLMSENAAAEYYAAWQELGTVCDEGGYASLFNRSTMMITDCGSFLTEYASTGKPIIHLVSSDNTLQPMPPSKVVYDTYYDVLTAADLQKNLDELVGLREDPRRDERMAAVKRAKLEGGNAALSIVSHIKGLIG